MNQIMDNILTRRSVRAFEKKDVPAEALAEILKAAQYAPSGMNRQTWQFTAITHRDKIQALAAAVGSALNRKDYDMYDPAVLIITSNEPDNHLGQDDNACAMENIFLSAHSLGIGSVWINQVRDVCSEPSVRTLLKEWGVPDSHVVYGVAALGYAAPAPEKAVLKNGKTVIV